MRVVVMDEDMREPITVVEIPFHLMREIEQRTRRDIVLAAPMRMEEWFTLADQIPNVQESTVLRHVRLRMEPIYKGHDVLYWVAVPDNPELALLLRAAFLPGQATELRRREAQAWFHGAVAALR
jgi:hypothetical protein